jgi:endonuclease/exonuclease/phosphatase family metal-dependent hydrolase
LKRLNFFIIALMWFLLVPALLANNGMGKNLRKKNKLTILTYNVHLCVGVDSKTDYQRVADVINRINPQVVALQELDSATQRSDGYVTLNELATRTNMYPVYGPYFEYEGGKYGIGILSKEKPVKWQSIPIPGRRENRLLIVELEDYILCCTHLSGIQDAKLKSVEILNDLLEESSKPVFFAGDLNSVPGSEVINNIEARWIMLNNPSLPTFPSNNPQKCIDYIFALKDNSYTFKINHNIVEKEPVASDHCPVWVEVVITEKE